MQSLSWNGGKMWSQTSTGINMLSLLINQHDFFVSYAWHNSFARIQCDMFYLCVLGKKQELCDKLPQPLAKQVSDFLLYCLSQRNVLLNLFTCREHESVSESVWEACQCWRRRQDQPLVFRILQRRRGRANEEFKANIKINWYINYFFKMKSHFFIVSYSMILEKCEMTINSSCHTAMPMPDQGNKW